MKSLLSDQQIKTSCKNCQCAIYDNDTQSNCALNRIEKFRDSALEAYDEEKEFYVIKRFCNYYRSPQWNGGVLDTLKIEHESSISFDVFVDCTDLSTDIDTKDLIDILNNIDYYKDKLNIVLVHSSSCSKNIRTNILKVFSYIKCQITEYIDLNEYLHNFLGSSRSTYHVVADVSNKSELKLLPKLNDVINNDVKQATAFNLKTLKVLSNIIYRIESSVNDETDYSVNSLHTINKSLESNLSIDIYDEE